jgi:hypothetical protein
MRATISTIVGLAVLSVAVAAMAEERRPTGTQLKPEELKVMSLEQMLDKGDKALGAMKGMTDDVLKSFSDAQDQKDFPRINCIGDTLTTIKGLMRLSEENAMTLKIKVIARDRSGAEHEFVKLTIAHGKVTEMHAQAKGCGGPAGETVFEGAPIVDRVFDADLPTEDPTAGLAWSIVFLDPPPSASPYY